MCRAIHRYVVCEMKSIIVIFNSHFQDNFDTLCVHLFRSDDDLDSIHNLLRKGHFCSGPSKGPRWFRPRLHMGSFIKSQKVSFVNTAFWQNLGSQFDNFTAQKIQTLGLSFVNEKVKNLFFWAHFYYMYQF